MRAKAFGLAAGFALALGSAAPADAQFFANYPVIIVPPPAQNLVMPKPAPKPAKPSASAPPSEAPAPEVQCHYQGQTRICQ